MVWGYGCHGGIRIPQVKNLSAALHRSRTIFAESLAIVPSALAAAMASLNIAFSSGSVLRRPTELPRPSRPPWKRGPVSTKSSLPGLVAACRQVSGRGHDRIDAAGLEVEVVLFSRLVFLNGDDVLQIFLQEGLRQLRPFARRWSLPFSMGSSCFSASTAPCSFDASEKTWSFSANCASGSDFSVAKVCPVVPVGITEGNDFLALRRRRHARNNGVELAGLQRAGIIPSKDWTTVVHSTFMWAQRYLIRSIS